MSLRRSYTDGPSTSQKLYGSSLPPSLRWGATTGHGSDPEQDEASQPDLYARPRRTSTHVYKKHDKRRNVARDHTQKPEKTLGVSERSRRPYANVNIVEVKPGPQGPPLMIEDIPERNKHDDDRSHSQDDEERGQDLKKPEAKITDSEGSATAKQSEEATGTREHHASVEDTEDVSKDSLQASATAGAEDTGALPKVDQPSDRRQLDNSQKTNGDEQASTEHAAQTDSMNDKQQPERPPVYAKIHVDYLSTQTLSYYDIPWEYDKTNRDYIILLREMDKHETNILFEHTQRLGRRPSVDARHRRQLERSRARARVDKKMRRNLARKGLTKPQVNAVMRMEQGHMRDVLLDTGFHPSQVDAIMNVAHRNKLSDSKPTNAGTDADSDGSEDSDQASETEGPVPWFQKSWSVTSDDPHGSQDIISSHLTTHAPIVDTKARHKAAHQNESETFQPLLHQRARSWRRNLVAASIQPELKQVVHATYGDILEDRLDKYLYSPGFIALPQSSNSQGDALYHICHFQQDTLDFEKFKRLVTNMPELHTIRSGLDEHLSAAQSIHEQLQQNGSASRDMKGFCHVSEGTGAHPRIALISMPFLQLKRHGQQTEAQLKPLAVINRLRGRTAQGQNAAESQSDHSHPSRTLFQYLNPRNNSRRDLKQVVCRTLDPRDGRFLFVSQVWILVVNEELIVTSSNLSEKDLFEDLLLTPASQPTPRKGTVVNIHVRSVDRRVWVLNRSDCATYFDFASHFSDITHRFTTEFDVHFGDQIVNAFNWSRTMQEAQTSTVHLHLKRSKLHNGVYLGYYPKGPPLDALDTRIDLTEPQFPLQEGTNGGVQDLEKQFEKLVKDSRQHLGTKRYVHLDEQTESDAPSEDEGHPQFRDFTRGDDSAVRTSDESHTNGSSAGTRQTFQHSRSTGTVPETKWGIDLIYTLPEAFTQAKVLTHLGLDFKEEARQLVLTKGLSKTQLSTIIRMTAKLSALEELREITCVLFDPASMELVEQNVQRDGIDTESINAATKDIWADLLPPNVIVFDEKVLYQASSSIARPALQSRLSKWRIEPISHASVQIKHVDEFSPELDTRAFCDLLGCADLKFPNIMTGEEVSTPLSPFDMFHLLLNGLSIMLATSKVDESSSELLEAEGRLSAAVYHLATSIHRSVEVAADLPARVYLNSMMKSFSQLFETLVLLRTHGLTIEKIHDIGRTEDAAEYSITQKHIVTAVILATRAWRELEDCGEVIEAEFVRRKHAMVNAPLKEFHQLDYERVEECCRDIFAMPESIESPDSTEAKRQKCLQRGVDRLETLGWGKDAAFIIIRNECRWKRVLHHTTTAVGMIEPSFIAALRADPAKNIRRKAAALPTDLAALLMSRVLWRPVVGDQDALDMYNQYMTDLESNIFTGEPSREPLDRIRYLRHELNAVSQLQQEQLDLLAQITHAFTPLDRQRGDPHPRHTVFDTLSWQVRSQKNIVMKLTGMLDDLQNEARAQISGVQDWRENAAVVFTVITVIFLPLSFVASVFGMNTSDIRDMALTQWTFWASACSFTIVVVLVTVYFVDVPPLWRWLERKGGGDHVNEPSARAAAHSKGHSFDNIARQRRGHGVAVADSLSERKRETWTDDSAASSEGGSASSDEEA